MEGQDINPQKYIHTYIGKVAGEYSHKQKTAAMEGRASLKMAAPAYIQSHLKFFMLWYQLLPNQWF